jgi:hypothetical protein
MSFRGLLVAMILAASTALVSGQVVARQGAASTETEFRSPMVLELPFGVIAHLAPSSGKKFPEVEKYVGDDTSLRSLLVTRIKDAPAKGSARFTISGSVYVRPSYDRVVRLRFSILNGTRVVGSTETPELDSEERELTPFQAELSIPTSELKAFSDKGAKATLQVIVTVADNR